MRDFSDVGYAEWVELGLPTRAEFEAQEAEHERKASELEAKKRELLKAQKDEIRELERQAPHHNPYGRAGVIGGGAAPGSAYVPPERREEKFRQDFARRFNAAPVDRGHRLGISADETDRYCSSRFVEHLRTQVALHAGYRR